MMLLFIKNRKFFIKVIGIFYSNIYNRSSLNFRFFIPIILTNLADL